MAQTTLDVDVKLQHFTINLSPIVRHDTMGGRKYLVAPMAMIVEGVLNGSNGPLLYPADELSKTPEVWNHKPIVVYHPQINGKGVSACDPDIITTYSIGVMMNTRFDSTSRKLLSEAWLEEERLDVVDKRIKGALERNQTLELSTGLFTDNEPVAGEFNGKHYEAVARNYRPDHLAILPDRVGACSIADGAGFLRLNEGMTFNGMSFANISDALRGQVHKKGEDYWVEDVYDGFVVFNGPNGAFYRQAYTIKENLVELSGVPEQVVRVTEYRTLDGTFVGNAPPVPTTLITKEVERMNKKDLLDKLIANAKSGVTEDDREGMMALSETVLGNMLKVVETPEPVIVVKPPEATTNVEPPKPEPPKPMTASEYIANAPDGIRDMLQDSLSLHNQRRSALIETIVANKANTFVKEQLESKPLVELQAIANLAQSQDEPQRRPVDFSGAAGAMTGNVHVEEPLSIPVMDFSK